MASETTQGGKPKPPRAAPLQPDRPGRDLGRTDQTSQDEASDAAAERIAEQEQTALKNVREGYKR